MAQIAWIGLGNMGRGMCKNLVEKGGLKNPLIVFNRTTKRATDLAEALGPKVQVAETVEDAAKRASMIFICLGDDAAVTEIIDRVLRQDVAGKLIVDCSTVAPDTTNALATKINAKGAEFVACPVFGAPPMADAGQLICVLAGPSASVEKVRPYCKGVMGRAEIDFSDQQHGQATLLKVIGNTFVFNMIESLSEGHALAEKSGLGTANLHKFVEALFPGPYTAYSMRMLSGDYYKRQEPLFAVDLALKDVRHANTLADEVGAKMGGLSVAGGHLKMVKEHMGARGDVAGIYGAVRKESGLEFEN